MDLYRLLSSEKVPVLVPCTLRLAEPFSCCLLVVLSLLECHTVSCGGRIPVVLSAMDFSLLTVVVDGRVTCCFCQVLLLQIGSQDPHNLTAFTAQFFTIVSVVSINVMLLHHGLGGTLWIQCW